MGQVIEYLPGESASLTASTTASTMLSFALLTL